MRVGVCETSRYATAVSLRFCGWARAENEGRRSLESRGGEEVCFATAATGDSEQSPAGSRAACLVGRRGLVGRPFLPSTPQPHACLYL